MTTVQRLLSEHARIARMRRFAAWLRVGAVGVGVLMLGAMVLGKARWIALPRPMPFVLWLAAAAAGWGLWEFQRRRRALQTSADDVARAIEAERGLRDGAARTLLEVAPLGGPFVERADALLGARLGADALAPQLTRNTQRALFGAVAGAVAMIGSAMGTTVSHGDGWRALFHPTSAWAGTLLPSISFDDPPAGLLRGDTARLAVHAPGRGTVTVRQRATGGRWRDTVLTVRDGVAAWRVGPLDADLAIVATDGRASSDTLRLRLAERSFVGDVKVTAHFPSYLGRSDETMAADGALRIPQGTSLQIAGRASEPLAAVSLGGDGESVALTISGMSFAGRWTPRASALLTWKARGATAAIADVPPALQVDVVPDSAPQVEFLAPSNDSSVTPGGTVRVAVAAADDRVLRDVTLSVWTVRDGRATAPQSHRLFDGGAPSYIGAMALQLGALSLQAGDVVHVLGTAHDDAPWGQTGKSRELLLRVPGVEDQRREARAAADSLVEKALAAARAQQQLEQRTSDAARARTPADAQKGKTPDAMSYDAAEKAKALAKDQAQMAARAREVQEATKELEERMRAAGGLDSSLQAQLREAQKLMREALTPELMQAMKKLEGAAQDLSQDRTRQSMADLAEQQKRLREALDKSAEMLKRAALEGQMKTLREDAASMAKKQQQMADSGAGDASRAKAVAQQTADLAKEIQQLQQRLERERANAGARQAEAAASQAQASREAMQRAAEQGTKQGREQAAREAAQAMQQAGQQLQQAREQQVAAWKNDITGSLDKAVQEMMQMARQQEQLADQAGKSSGDQQGDTRAQQSALQQGVQRASERLADQAKKSAMVSPGTQQAMKEAQQRVDQAMRDANNAQQGQGQQQSANSMRDAAQALRQAASSLARDRERVDGAQSGSGVPEMVAELQKLAQQQGEVNAQMASLFPNPNQGRQSADASSIDKARVLARQQRAVAKALDEVQDLDATGKAREMAREARTLAQALEAGAADPSTLDRQQRLFRKMLDAGRLLQQEERDEQGPRESKPGDKVSPFAPPDANVHGREALKYRTPTWDELKTLAPEERRAVLEYFRRLNGAPPTAPQTDDGGRKTDERGAPAAGAKKP